jgi:hypothetical protein
MPRSPLLIATHDERQRATRVAVARMFIGSSMLFFTGASRRVFGIPAGQDYTSLRVVCRLFGIRNITLGLWTLAARQQPPEARRRWYQLNAAVDAADVAVVTIGGVAGEGFGRAALMGGVLGTSALLAWLDLIGELDREER